MARCRNCQLLIGGNSGKNKDTPNERAAKDYVACFEAPAAFTRPPMRRKN